MSLIHRYKSYGFNIVLDINSGCIHLVDEVTYEVLPYLEEGLGTEAIAEKLENKYNREDRKSTRLNSSHPSISYAVFCM